MEAENNPFSLATEILFASGASPTKKENGGFFYSGHLISTATSTRFSGSLSFTRELEVFFGVLIVCGLDLVPGEPGVHTYFISEREGHPGGYGRIPQKYYGECIDSVFQAMCRYKPLPEITYSELSGTVYSALAEGFN